MTKVSDWSSYSSYEEAIAKQAFIDGFEEARRHAPYTTAEEAWEEYKSE